MKIGLAACRHDKWPKVDWLSQAFGRIGHEVLRSTGPVELDRVADECDLLVLAHRALAGRWANVKHVFEIRRCPILYWWWDLVATDPGIPIGRQPLFHAWKRQFRGADLVLVKERGLLDEYREAGVNAQWCDQGCPRDIPSVTGAEKEWDVLLWGQVYRERARDVQSLLDAGLSVAWASSQSTPKGCERLPWAYPFDLPKLASKARCVMSCGARNDVEGYWSDSFWMAVGMGACVVRRLTPGMPEGPYLTYRNSEELCDQVRRVKQNPRMADEMGAESRQWVMKEHTIEHRASDALAVRIARTAGRRW